MLDDLRADKRQDNLTTNHKREQRNQYQQPQYRLHRKPPVENQFAITRTGGTSPLCSRGWTELHIAANTHRGESKAETVPSANKLVPEEPRKSEAYCGRWTIHGQQVPHKVLDSTEEHFQSKSPLAKLL